MARLSPQGPFRALDQNGNPLNGGKLYTYEAGTSTPKVTYTTADESTPNTNPIILDSEGYANVWLESGSYKFVLNDSTDVNQWTVDDIVGQETGGYLSQVVTQSTNLNITSVYKNNLIICTASLTLSLLPSATAGEGFVFSVKNTSAGDVTIDPDGSETIDGQATLIIPAGESADIVCDGSNWVTYGKFPYGVGTDPFDLVQLDASSRLPAVDGSQLTNLANLGKIRQVVSAVSTSNQTENAGVYTDISGLTASITPESASNIIVVLVQMSIGFGTNPTGIGFKLLRDATTIYGGDDATRREGASIIETESFSILNVDSPATTSSTTYKVQFARISGGSGIAYMNPSVLTNPHTILLVEVEV